jgi:hypothetical protein
MVDTKSSVSMVMTMATMAMYVQSDPTGSGGHSAMDGSTG